MEECRGNALVSFWTKNVRCYRDEVSISMEATRLANDTVVRELPTASATPMRLLPVAGIFGANASGKSALLDAMWDMRCFVLQSFRSGMRRSKIPRVPFLLEPDCADQPSEYGIELILNGVAWRYGFEINDERVVSEFAVHYPKGREALVFERQGEEAKFGPSFRPTGNAVEPLRRRNALLLSTIGAIDSNAITPLFEWIEDNLLLANTANRHVSKALTAELAEHDPARTPILELLRAADLGIVDATVKKADEETVEKLHEAIRTMTGAEGEAVEGEHAVLDASLMRVHLKHRGKAGAVWVAPEYESMGTEVWTSLVGPILLALDRGNVLLIDEIDGSLHPLLVERLVTMFQSPRSNPHCAQLVFNAHDVHLFNIAEPHQLGRDQIWTVEKDADGVSRLQSVAEYKPRADEVLGRRYLRGRYGGIPRLNPGAFEHAARAEQAEA